MAVDNLVLFHSFLIAFAIWRDWWPFLFLLYLCMFYVTSDEMFMFRPVFKDIVISIRFDVIVEIVIIADWNKYRTVIRGEMFYVRLCGSVHFMILRDLLCCRCALVWDWLWLKCLDDRMCSYCSCDICNSFLPFHYHLIFSKIQIFYFL